MPNLGARKMNHCANCFSSIACESFDYCREINLRFGMPTISEKMPDGYIYCWIGDYDLDIAVGTGKTKAEAIVDLMEKLDEKEDH
jgi:hypothetical protein